MGIDGLVHRGNTLGFKYVVLLAALVMYAFLGGLLFHHLEHAAALQRQRDVTRESVQKRNQLTDRIMILVSGPTAVSELELRLKLDELLSESERGETKPTEWNWDLTSSTFYAGTLFTTVGYGNMVCHTRACQLATVVYSAFGLPLMLLFMTNIGRLLFIKTQFVYARFMRHVKRHARRMSGRIVLKKTEEEKKIKDGEETGHGENEDDDDDDDSWASFDEQLFLRTYPVSLALLIVVIYTAVCATFFSYLEQWDYWTSAYFFLISLSTIGLGDVVPKSPSTALGSSLLLLLGLSLESMCVSLMHAKMEARYMAALQLIDQETSNMQQQESEPILRITTPQITVNESANNNNGSNRKSCVVVEEPSRPTELLFPPPSPSRLRAFPERPTPSTDVDRPPLPTSTFGASSLSLYSADPLAPSPLVAQPLVLGVLMARSSSKWKLAAKRAQLGRMLPVDDSAASSPGDRSHPSSFVFPHHNHSYHHQHHQQQQQQQQHVRKWSAPPSASPSVLSPHSVYCSPHPIVHPPDSPALERRSTATLEAIAEDEEAAHSAAAPPVNAHTPLLSEPPSFTVGGGDDGSDTKENDT